MKLLIVAMWLLLQATSPVPRKAPQSATDTPNTIQKQSDAKQQPSEAPALVKSQVQSESTKPHDKNDQNAQTDHQIKVTEFPPVSIKRDEVDWALWLFNFALVVVGFLQWKVLRRQAQIAHNQELQMIEAGKQTKEIIAQMKDTAVRDLRGYVGVSKILLDLGNPQVPEGLVEIQNFGKTPAYKVRHRTAIGIESYPPSAPLQEIPQSRASVTVIFPQIKNLGKVGLKKPLPLGVSIGTPDLTIYVYGKITYEDAFGNERFCDFRFVFGGVEEPVTYHGDNGRLYGVMRPDSEGNDAN
jgi:hypothetical protein